MKATGEPSCMRRRDGESMGWVPARRKTASENIIVFNYPKCLYQHRVKKGEWLRGARAERKEGQKLPQPATHLMFVLTRTLGIILFQQSLCGGYDYSLVIVVKNPIILHTKPGGITHNNNNLGTMVYNKPRSVSLQLPPTNFGSNPHDYTD